MGMIKIFQAKSKPAKKKPGWQQAEAEHAAWLGRVNSQTLFNPAAKPKMQKSTKKIDLVVRTTAVDPDRSLYRHLSLNTAGGAGTKPVPRPDILYREDPEMLARELLARERKFNSAPMYNKGPAQYVSDDIDADLKTGSGRRR